MFYFKFYNLVFFFPLRKILDFFFYKKSGEMTNFPSGISVSNAVSSHSVHLKKLLNHSKNNQAAENNLWVPTITEIVWQCLYRTDLYRFSFKSHAAANTVNLLLVMTCK